MLDAFNNIRESSDASLAARLDVITSQVNDQLAAAPKEQDEQAILGRLERDVTVRPGPG